MSARKKVSIFVSIIAALFFVGPGLIASAHSATVLTGKLLEKGTKRPLPDVNVFLLPEKIKATSTANGTFEFQVEANSESTPPKAQRQIVINLTGYQRFERSFVLPLGNFDLGALYIERVQYSGFETVVVGKTKKRDDQEQILKPEDFLLAPGANRDPVKAIQNLAGVNRANAGTSQIIVQGAEPEDTRYNLDGHTIPLIFHFGGLSSVLYPDSIESVSLLGAGYGPEFGQALGGHVGLRSRSPKSDFWSGQAFIDIFNAGFMAEGPVSPTGSLLISSRYSYIGAVIKKIAESQESFGFTAAPSFADLSIIYEEKINATDRLKITALGSMDQLEAVFKDPVNGDPALRGRFSNKTDFFRIITAWNRKLENDDEVSTSIGVGKDSILVDVGDNFFRLDANRLTTRGEYITHWNRENQNLKSYFGWDNDYTWFEIGIRLPEVSGAGGVGTPISVGPTKEAAINDRAHLTGFYNRNLWKVSDSLTIIPGLRIDSNRTTKEWMLGPRLAFRLMPTSSMTYRLATGVYYQPPSGQQTSEAFGNPTLKSPRALHLNLGWEKDFKENSSQGSTLSLGGFYKSLDRLVIRSSAQVERNGSTVTENFNNDGTGNIFGTEVSWKYTFSEGTLGANYTFSQSRRSQPGQSEFPSAFDQTHNLNLLASYRPEAWQRWIFTGRFRYVTGSPLTPVTGGVFDADQDVYVPVRGAFFSERKSSFMQLDIRGEYKWVYDTWILAAYADIQNILNQKNVESVDYSYDYSQREDVMGLGILPTIGVRGEF